MPESLLHGAVGKQSENFGYMQQLDTLRAVAVGGVLLSHYLGEHLFHALRFNWGALGVRLFFVISGYLITGILLKARNDGANRVTMAHVARQFYIRRVFRIFPIFYASIFLAAAFGLPHVRESFLWHVTYLSNFWIAENGWVFPFSHLWSLAVEEQFYLLWPWVILFVPKRWLVTACVGAIVLAVVYRLITVKLGGWLWPSVMMPGCLDTLGMGALLAVVQYQRYFTSKTLGRALIVLAVGGAIVTCVVQPLIAGTMAGKLLAITNDTWLGFIFAWVVYACSIGVRGVPGQLLQLPPILYLGRISYGIYVLHLFVPAALQKLAADFGVSYPTNHVLLSVVYTTITIVLASLSWRFFEKPINDLKRHFPYVEKLDAKSSERATEPIAPPHS